MDKNLEIRGRENVITRPLSGRNPVWPVTRRDVAGSRRNLHQEQKTAYVIPDAKQ